MSKGLEDLLKLKQYLCGDMKTEVPIWLFNIETELKRLEALDSVTKTLKEVIQFNMTMPTIDKLENGYTLLQKVALEQKRSLENKERELFRNWILKECFPKELKALEIIKETFDWEVMLPSYEYLFENNKEKYELLKEELLNEKEN